MKLVLGCIGAKISRKRVRLVAGVRERLVLRCALTVGPMAIGLRQRGTAGSTTVSSGFMTATDRVAASAGQRDAPASELLTPHRKPDTRSSIRGTSGNRQAHAAATTRPQKEGKEISDQIVDRTAVHQANLASWQSSSAYNGSVAEKLSHWLIVTMLFERRVWSRPALAGS
jgi:hypothetical protein